MRSSKFIFNTCFGAAILVSFMTSCSPLEKEIMASGDVSSQKQKGDSPDKDKAADIFFNFLGVAYVNISGMNDEVPIMNTPEGVMEEKPKIKNNIMLRTGLEYIMKGYKSKPSGASATKIHLNYIEIPLQIVYMHHTSTGAFYGGLGPYLAYGIGGKIKGENFTLKSFSEDEGGYKRFDAGLSLTAGYRVNNGISLNLTYDYGLANITYANTDIKAYNRTLSLNVGYDISRLFQTK